MNNKSTSSLIEQVEIEAKLQILAHNLIEILAPVDDLQALLNSEEKNVKDIYLDTVNSFLTSEDRLFRIRISTGLGGASTELSWKGPRTDKEIDTREDVSMLFQNDMAKEFVRLLERIGYNLT